MRREAATAAIGGLLALGIACGGDSTLGPDISADAKKGGGGGSAGGGGSTGTRTIFPADNAWNTDISAAPERIRYRPSAGAPWQ